MEIADLQNDNFVKAIMVPTLVNTTIDPNPLGEALEEIVALYFSDIANSPELLQKVFVEDSCRAKYLAKMNSYFERLREVYEDVQDVRLEAGDQNAEDLLKKEINEFRKARRDKVLILVGRIGCGKSTLMKKFFEISLREKGEADDIIYIYIDLISGADETINLKEEIEARILQSLTKDYKRLDLLSWKTELRIFHDLVEGIYLSGQAFEEVTHEQYKSRISNRIEQKKKNRAVYIRYILHYIIDELKMIPCIVFDNVDALDDESQKKVLQLSLRKASSTRGVVVITLRGGTFLSLYENWLNSYSNMWTKVFHLEPPNFTTVLERRIECLLQRLDKSRISFKHDGYTFTVEDVKALMQLVLNTLVESGDNKYRIIDAMTNHNLREAFDLLIDITTSGHIPVIEYVKAYIDKKIPRIPYHNIISALMLSNYKYYLENRSHIKNIFDYDGPEGENPHILLLYRILTYMCLLTKGEKQMRRKRYIVQDFCTIGYSKTQIDLALRKLFDKKLMFTWQYNKDSSTIANDHDCYISDRGIFYHTHLIYSFQYIQKVIEDVYLPKSLDITLIKEDYDLPLKIEHVKRFYAYLKVVEHKELETLKDINEYKISDDRIVKKIAPQLMYDLTGINKKHNLGLDLSWLDADRVGEVDLTDIA